SLRSALSVALVAAKEDSRNSSSTSSAAAEQRLSPKGGPTRRKASEKDEARPAASSPGDDAATGSGATGRTSSLKRAPSALASKSRPEGGDRKPSPDNTCTDPVSAGNGSCAQTP